MTNRIAGLWGGHEAGSDFPSETRLDAEYLKQQSTEVLRQVRCWIAEYPASALGAALATGVLLGWLLKRK